MKKLPLIAFGVTLVAGAFVLGLVVASSVREDLERVSSHSVIASNETEVESTASAESSPSLTIESIADLKDLGRFSSHFERKVSIHDLVASLDEQALVGQLEQSTGALDQGIRWEAQLAIVGRLAAIDPEAALAAVYELDSDRDHVLLKAVFHEWSVTNLDQSVEHAQSLDAGAKDAALESILMSREDLSTERRRELARRFGAEWVAIEVIERTQGATPLQHPKGEWSSLARSVGEGFVNPTDAQMRLMTHIASEWVLAEGVDAFSEILDSLSTHSTKSSVSREVALHLVDTHPSKAFDLAVHLRTLGVLGLAKSVASEWSKTEPWAALNAVASIESKYHRADLHAEILETWANSDPDTLLNQVSELPEDLQSLARKKALLSLSRSSPQIAAEVIGDVEDRASRDEIATAIVSNWSILDITSALDWMRNEASVAHYREELTVAAFQGLAESDPQAALELALAQPTNEEGIGPEAGVIESLTFRDMDTAVAMLSQVREGKTKISAYESVILIMASIRKDSDQAVDLFIQLSTEEEIPRNAFVTTQVVLFAPRALFDGLERLESMDLRRRVARSLLSFHGESDFFSDEQIAVLEEVKNYGEAERKARRQTALEEMRQKILESTGAAGNESE